MEITAQQLAKLLGGRVEGNPDALVAGFARIENGKPGKLSFFANPKYEEYVYTSKASVLLVNDDFKPRAVVEPTLVRVPDAYSAVARLLKWAADQKKAYKRHRGLCRIACSARIGRKVWIGDFTKIGRGCRIGDKTKIYDNVSIGEGSCIGSDCIIYPGVRIYPGTVIGSGVIVHENAVIGSDGFGNAPQEDGSWEKIEHLGNVIIGDNCEIGACTTIDRAQMESTIIGKGVKIDDLCVIAHNVEIGDNTVMAAQCGIAGSTKIGKNCILAGQVGIVGHLSIADHTVIGAQSGVIKSITQPDTTVMGSPAFAHRAYLKAYSKFRRSADE